MEGFLKKAQFVVRRRDSFSCPEAGTWVQITDKEDHPIFGPRYKVRGYSEWFEENCFDEIRK